MAAGWTPRRLLVLGLPVLIAGFAILWGGARHGEVRVLPCVRNRGGRQGLRVRVRAGALSPRPDVPPPARAARRRAGPPRGGGPRGREPDPEPAQPPAPGV